MNRWPLILVAVLIAALAILATLQFRWIAQVNEAQEQRMRSELEGAARRFSEEINRELIRVIAVFEMRTPDMAEVTRRYNEWKERARDPKLIASLHLAENVEFAKGFDPERLVMVVPIRQEMKLSPVSLVVEFDSNV